MTDTTILDGMMSALARNPLTPERLGHVHKRDVPEGEKYGIELQARTTDERPFYARREVVTHAEANQNFSEVIDLFHEDITVPRSERPRMGSCGNVRTVMRLIDGQTWTRTESCPGTVHAVETVIDGAIRVDGKCLSCGWEVHRAGLLNGRK